MKITAIIAFIALTTLILFKCVYVLTNLGTPIKEGDIYLHSLQWEEENPFICKQIDTVKVLQIIDGYVKFELKNGSKYFQHSTTISCFVNDIRELPKNKIINLDKK